MSWTRTVRSLNPMGFFTGSSGFIATDGSPGMVRIATEIVVRLV